MPDWRHFLSEIFAPLTWFPGVLELLTYTSPKIWLSVGKETDAGDSDNRDHIYIHKDES
jgi:hypothetical protein